MSQATSIKGARGHPAPQRISVKREKIMTSLSHLALAFFSPHPALLPKPDPA
jgi:hypothetical protein